jgi:hypothetical protein
MPCRLRITMSLMISIGEWEWTLMTCLMRYIYSLVCQCVTDISFIKKCVTDIPPSYLCKKIPHILCLEFWLFLLIDMDTSCLGLACAWGENRYCKHWPFRWCAFWVSEEKPLCAHNFKQPWRWWHQMHYMSGIFVYCDSTLLTVTISSPVQQFLY